MDGMLIAILILIVVIVAWFSDTNDSDNSTNNNDIYNKNISVDYNYIKSKLADEIATKIIAGNTKKEALVELWYDYYKATHNTHDASDIVKMVPEELGNKISTRLAERNKRVVAVATMCTQTLEAILKIEYSDVDINLFKKACQSEIKAKQNKNTYNNKKSEQKNTEKTSIQTVKLADIDIKSETN